ncbi:floral homeotic protein HUA1 [Prunus dulcis]|uniref:Floral homeotic protein HUA1 n=1 Tax=Prunus dulcis TaxID=3755 RepID=A0A5H2XFM8_PRUDU|nr:floral homeotic protein HUA1 [Prunus dulcis]
MQFRLSLPSESLPERHGEPDCPYKYFIKTQRCKFGMWCKFNHPKDKLAFGATCKFHHLKDILIPSAEQENTIGETRTTIQPEGTEFAVKPLVSFSPALSFNSKGLPVRPGEPDCPFDFYLIGSCKYGATWARLKRTEKGTMGRSCCCLHHALSTVNNTSFGEEKKATQRIWTPKQTNAFLYLEKDQESLRDLTTSCHQEPSWDLLMEHQERSQLDSC